MGRYKKEWQNYELVMKRRKKKEDIWEFVYLCRFELKEQFYRINSSFVKGHIEDRLNLIKRSNHGFYFIIVQEEGVKQKGFSGDYYFATAHASRRLESNR
jgi:hypothetical protein